MIRNYLTIAVRNILRHKGYSTINIAGLAISMAVCILILLWITDELSYDRFHVNADRIHRCWKKVFWETDVRMNAALPVGLAMLLSLTTVVVCIFRAARANPVEALKYE